MTKAEETSLFAYVQKSGWLPEDIQLGYDAIFPECSRKYLDLEDVRIKDIDGGFSIGVLSEEKAEELAEAWNRIVREALRLNKEST